MIRSSTNSRLAQFIDFITAIAGYYLTFYVLVYLNNSSLNNFSLLIEIDSLLYFTFAFFSGVTAVLFFWFNGLYSSQRYTSFINEILIVFKVNLLILLTIILFIFSFKIDLARVILVLFCSINILLFILQKMVLFIFATYIRATGKNRKRILIVGDSKQAVQFIDTVKKNYVWGLDIIGILSYESKKIGEDFFGFKIVGTFKDIKTVLKNINPEEVMILESTKRFNEIKNIINICEIEGVQIRLCSDFIDNITKKTRVDNIYGFNIVSFTTNKQTEIGLVIKRFIDIIGSFIAIILFSPFMMIAVIGIYFSVGRPIIYNWNVIGLHKKPFKSWKFRTMVKNADNFKNDLLHFNEMEGPVFKIKNDPRIFTFGKWLRKWSIDETPQLLSVLLGDMSLVGPRPAGSIELEGYESWHRRKLSVKPGLTCLWQVNGRNKINKFDDWVKLDLYYIDNWSLLLDFKILFKTIPAVLLRKGAS